MNFLGGNASEGASGSLPAELGPDVSWCHLTLVVSPFTSDLVTHCAFSFTAHCPQLPPVLLGSTFVRSKKTCSVSLNYEEL